MVFRVFDSTKPAALAALGLVVTVAGCQSGNPIGALNVGGGQSQEQQQEQITQAELRAYCPALTLRSSDAVRTVYARNAEGDASQVVYRASISDTTRSCTYGPGTMGMTFAVAGRIVPGPQGSAGTVTLPVQITVYQNTDVIFSQTFNQQVAIADTAGATQFMFTDSSFSMPTPTARNVRIFVGFENGPAAR